MLATWLAALLFLFALQALAVVKLADRLSIEAKPAGTENEVESAAPRYARAA